MDLSNLVNSFLMIVGLLLGDSSNVPIPLAKVDLSKITGGWYIVATMPNFLERGVVGGYDVFSLEPAGIREDFYMQLHRFDNEKRHFEVRITIQPGTGNADWRVHVLPFVSLPFQVLYTDPGYKFVLFGEQNREWGWIYSRSQQISDFDYEEMLGEFARMGYDISKFRKFVQTPEQIGRPGFWSDGIKKSE